MASTGAPAARSHLWLERSKAVACSPRATTTSCSTTAVCFASSVPVFLLLARSRDARCCLPSQPRRMKRPLPRAPGGTRNSTTGSIQGDSRRFPEGMAAFIEKIHGMGFKFVRGQSLPRMYGLSGV